jgi:hypothetical protein
VKLAYPTLPTFASVQLADLYGMNQGQPCYNLDVTPCIEQRLPPVQQARMDIFAISDYPRTFENGSFDITTWLQPVLPYLPKNTTFAVAETGRCLPIILSCY